MKTLFGTLLIGLIFISSCKKSTNASSKNDILTEEATIRWTGSYAVDGCGFMLGIHSVEFKADNEKVIDKSYQISGDQNVTLEFYTLNDKLDMPCGDSKEPFLFNGLHIISIKRR